MNYLMKAIESLGIYTTPAAVLDYIAAQSRPHSFESVVVNPPFGGEQGVEMKCRYVGCTYDRVGDLEWCATHNVELTTILFAKPFSRGAALNWYINAQGGPAKFVMPELPEEYNLAQLLFDNFWRNRGTDEVSV